VFWLQNPKSSRKADKIQNPKSKSKILGGSEVSGFVMWASPLAAAQHDVLIRNGMVYDGSGNALSNSM
jgi:ribosomal protein S6E (S10)